MHDIASCIFVYIQVTLRVDTDQMLDIDCCCAKTHGGDRPRHFMFSRYTMVAARVCHILLFTFILGLFSPWNSVIHL